MDTNRRVREQPEANHPELTHRHPHHHGDGTLPHTHAHGHTLALTPNPRGPASSRRNLRLAFGLTLVILLVEVAGAWVGHSLALLSDAGHVVTDVVALGLAWFAATQAERPANARKTFGYHRVGILVALGNGLTLVAITVVILHEAFSRLVRPEPVHPEAMFLAAGVGIALNLLIARGLHTGHGDLSIRAAALHVLGDVAASGGVVLGGLIILATRAYWVDPLVSIAIAVLVAISAWRLIRETVDVLLEATPRGLSMGQLVLDMVRVHGVHDIHDLHVWSLTPGMLALSCHAVIDDLPPSESAATLDTLIGMLARNYGIGHATIQFESQPHADHSGYCACPPGVAGALYCILRPGQFDARPHADSAGASADERVVSAKEGEPG